MFRSTFLLLLIASVVGRSFAKIEGVEVPEIQLINGMKLKRNGHGVRSISFFGMDIKVYVAGFYSKSPLLTEEDVHECRRSDDCPMQLDFTFLRSVGKGKVISAWTQQLEHSVSHRYEGYENDRDTFIDLFSSPIAYSGTQTVQLVGDDTFIVDQGEYKGRISGKDFQKAFLSMWFGERAVAEDLKAGLLSGTFHLEELAAHAGL